MDIQDPMYPKRAATYVPPHLRGRVNGTTNLHGACDVRNTLSAMRSSSWNVTSSDGNYGSRKSRYGGDSFGLRGSSDQGAWWDGKHIIGTRNQRLERELFGSHHDSNTVSTGINFDKYDDIPVEVSGTDVPEPISVFTSPPLDSHLLSNIELANYKNPTPVQKHSISIVIQDRDLMACAQTGVFYGYT